MKKYSYINYNTAAKLLKLKTASFIIKYIETGVLKSVCIIEQSNGFLRPMVLRSEVLKLRK